MTNVSVTDHRLLATASGTTHQEESPRRARAIRERRRVTGLKDTNGCAVAGRQNTRLLSSTASRSSTLPSDRAREICTITYD